MNYKIADTDLLDLQKKYRNGNIEETDIAYDKLQDLKKLYNYQIKSIEESIESDRQKITEIRKRIENINN